MMPLIMADAGMVYGIKRIGGEGTQRQFIEGLGFVPGAEVVIISKMPTISLSASRARESR